MNKVGTLIMHIAELAQAIIIVYFFVRLFEFHDLIKHKVVKTVGLISLLYIMAEISVAQNWNNMIFTIIWLVLLLIFGKVNLNKTWVQHLVWCMFSLLLIPLINIGLILVASSLSHMTIEQYTSVGNANFLFITFVSRTLYFVILSLILYLYKLKKVDLSKRNAVIVGVLFAYSILIEAILFAGFKFEKGLNSYKWGLIGIAFGVILIDVYLVIVIFKLSEKSKQDEKMKLLQMQNHFQEERLAELYSEENRIRRMRHDYKNHISNIATLIKRQEYQKLQEYITQIDEYYLKQNRGYVDTNNSILNATINTKFSLCYEKEIHTSCQIIGDYEETDGLRLGIILLNLFDNAIEASEKEKKKEIRLEMKKDEDYINILVKNRAENKVLISNPNLDTTKKEKKMHGLGLSHVKDIIEEMNGMFEIFEEEYFVCAHGMILTNDTLRKQFKTSK